jgi:tricorn protease
MGGKYIVYENAGYIYKYNIETKSAEKVNITIFDDALFARSEFKDASKNISSADVSPYGERIVFSARGDVYTVPYKSGITRNITQTTGVHERNACWSPDGKYIAYISDASGENEIYIQKQDGSEPPVQLTNNADTYKYKIVWSPDSKKIMWADRMLRLQYIDITTKQIVQFAKSKYSLLTNYSWSPDSRWIVWEQQSANRFATVWVYNLENKKQQAVTDDWFEALSPAFSSDGKYIVFVSCRDFKPTYSNVEWNIAYDNMMRVYLLPLRKNIPSPFAPENNEVKLDVDSYKSKKDSTPSSKTEIDFDHIESRIIDLPIKASTYDDVSCVNEVVYYIENPTGGGSTFKMFDLKKKEETELGKNIRYSLSANNKKMLVKEGANWAVIDLPSGKISFKDVADLNNMKVWVNYTDEWQQVYNECWRQMRDFFYVPNMHGLNWKAINQKYVSLVPHVRHRDDLTYLIGEMIGELNVGHAYINTGQKPKADKIAIGLLGAQVSKHSSGYFVVDKILTGANWSKALRSPLTEPGVDVKEGDFIIAIDGKALSKVNDLYELLQYKADKQVELTINNNPRPDNARKVIVIPIKDESNLYYFQWVQNNIKKVADVTNGEVGYIHIPDMGTEGLNEFVKYFYPQLNKKALIIDDRGNGGGNVSPIIIERLRRELTRSRAARNFDVSFPLPSETFLGPKVLLINQYSASDGDLFPYAFRKHKLGTIIGVRTWGGVVGISGSLPFMDGTELRKPEFATYSADTSAWIIEGYGVDPDIEQDNDAFQEFNGIDAQLNKAIEVIKGKLSEYKALPPIPPAPDKSN